MLAQEAVERAYREAAIKRIGATFTTAELNEGLDRLNGFLDSLFGAEIGELLTDVQVPQIQRATINPHANFNQGFPLNATTLDQPGMVEDSAPTEYVLANNSRVLWRGTTPTTVYFPQNPNDGSRIAIVPTGPTANLTLNGNGRHILSGNTVVRPPNNAHITYFYRADRGDWLPLGQLALTDELPLPAEFNRLIICGTAISLTALDQLEPSTGTMFTYNRLLRRCKERYYQRQAVTPGGQNLPQADQAFDSFGFYRQW